ncbi:MAG: pantetheine-phosphate adenylyltransferase [Acidobacteria bacterium]|nr:pantetheine-phosphate adenylyltransferase [Acidobacteriota bacterium]
MTRVHRLAVCPGSFDPLTNGHVDMIARAARLFDEIVVAVLANTAKTPWFTADARVALTREVLAARSDVSNVRVEAFDGLLAQYVRHVGAVAVVRGLRTSSELADESQMAMMNRHLNADCETVFLVPLPGVSFISSRLIKDVAMMGGSVDGLVPPAVARALAARRGLPYSVTT